MYQITTEAPNKGRQNELKPQRLSDFSKDAKEVRTNPVQFRTMQTYTFPINIFHIWLHVSEQRQKSAPTLGNTNLLHNA